jgi:hypothetical protein
LPKDIKDFNTLRVAEETSRNARKIFFAMLLGCVYSWLTIATTTDVRLLTYSTSSPLPIIGAEIPIVWFYWAAPLTLIGFFIYLHLYLQRLWIGLSGLPAKFPDGKRLYERAYPWLLNGLVRRYIPILKIVRPPIARLEEWVTIFLCWWAVSLTLFGFWIRFLPRHDWTGTYFHMAMIIGSLSISLLLFRLTVQILKGANTRKFNRKSILKNRRFYTYGSALLATGLGLYNFSFGAIIAVHPWYSSGNKLKKPKIGFSHIIARNC